MESTIRRLSAAVLLLAAGCVGIDEASGADFGEGFGAYLRGDYAAALKEWRPLAEQGDAVAQFNLGLMYAKGEGVPEDAREAVRWYRKAAEQGNAIAQFWLGVMYAGGKGIPEDAREAVRWYRKAAEQGNAYAQLNLGVMYADGEGVPEDAREAVRWYRKAAEQGHARAQFWLGAMYAKGEGVPEDAREAVRWYRKAAEQGNAYAQLNLGVMYAGGKGIPEDAREAVRWYRKAAEQGDAIAQFYLGVMYDGGKGVPENDREAVRWYRKAAEQGNAIAQFYLGVMYAKGKGVPEDAREAVRWYRKAAEQGNAYAQLNLGVMYDGGKGVPENDREAVRWYRRAAEQGEAIAQFWLGLMYAKGVGVPEDDRKAVRWYRKAAEQGDARAQLNLGVMYAKGEGVPEDAREAVRWYRRAAEQGEAVAQFNLGLMYAKGVGVPEDFVRAYAWFNLAAAQGHEDSKELRDVTRQVMTAAQVAEGQQLSRELAARIESGRIGSAASPIPGEAARPSALSPDTVLEAQKYLVALGYAPGPLDGRPGQRTAAAVRRFQRDLGLTPTGRIFEELLALLEAAAAARSHRAAEPAGSGSGFVAGDGGAIVTNHHVVDGCTKVGVAREGASHDTTVRATDPANDLALLDAPLRVGAAATFSRSPRARLGEVVTVAGYPLHGLVSTGLTVTGGNVSALVGVGDDARHVRITAPVQPGNSGGPLFDGGGNVIGVVVSKLDAIRAAKLTGDIPQNVNFAIKGALVRGFLDIHGVAYRRRASEPGLAPERLAERARASTVAVHCWR